MTQYELGLQVRIETIITQMSKINEHATNLLTEGKTLEQVQVWFDMFDDLEAEAESLILIRDAFAFC
jgi:hypothetical protein